MEGPLGPHDSCDPWLAHGQIVTALILDSNGVSGRNVIQWTCAPISFFLAISSFLIQFYMFLRQFCINRFYFYSNFNLYMLSGTGRHVDECGRSWWSQKRAFYPQELTGSWVLSNIYADELNLSFLQEQFVLWSTDSSFHSSKVTNEHGGQYIVIGRCMKCENT